jgi:outer membrane protein TolC
MKQTVLLLILASAAWGQDASLKAYVSAADTNNVDARLSETQRHRAEAEFRQAWTSLLPSLSVSGGWTHNQFEAKATIPTGPMSSITAVIIPGDQFDTALRVDLPLIDTTRWFRSMASNQAQLSAKERELVVRDQVKRQIVTVYYALAGAQAVLRAAQKSVQVALEQERLATIRGRAGSATELEVLRAHAEVQRSQQLIADSTVLVNTTARTLQTLSGKSPPDNVTLPSDDVSEPAPFAQLEPQTATLPAVRAAERDLSAAEKLSTAATLALVPQVSAQFTQRFTNATGFQGQSAVYNAGVNFVWRLDVPTFQAMDVQSTNVEAARLAIERASNAAKDQLFQDEERLNASRSKVSSATAQVDAARRAAQMASDRYAAGAATQVEVIQAERDVFSAEVAHIQARTELASARAQLRLSAGNGLE